MSGTGTGFGPLPSRERGYWRLFWLVVSPAPHLWIADQVRNDVVVVPGRVDSRLRGNDGKRDYGGFAGLFRIAIDNVFGLSCVLAG